MEQLGLELVAHMGCQSPRWKLSILCHHNAHPFFVFEVYLFLMGRQSKREREMERESFNKYFKELSQEDSAVSPVMLVRIGTILTSGPEVGLGSLTCAPSRPPGSHQHRPLEPHGGAQRRNF